MLVIDNDGPRIVSTNYFETGLAKAGKILVSCNASAFRVLVPPSREACLADMKTALGVAVSRGTWPAIGRPEVCEVLFDDGSEGPFALHLSVESFDRLPTPANVAGAWTCSVWTRSPDGRPHLARAGFITGRGGGRRRHARRPASRPSRRSSRP
jgi:hypothetical protein